MKKTLLFLIFFCCIATWGQAQITNAQVNYELRVDQWRQTCDNDFWTSDDNEVRIWFNADANTGGTAAWTNNCGTGYVRRWQADAPSTVTNNNTLLYYCTNRTNNSNYFTFNYQSWESDNGYNCVPQGGDDCHSSGTYNYFFKSAAKTPSAWWGYTGTAGGSFMTGNSGDFFAKTVWRHTYGAACNSALNFGTLPSGVTRTHTNSNRATPAGASATMGYTNIAGNTSPDVYYQFTISTPSTVVISTDNVGTNYDTYLRLYSNTGCGTQIAANDDGGTGTTSLITIDLCAGTYAILVEGFGGNTGNFNLSVRATTRPATGGTIAGIANGVAICPNTDPGAFTNSVTATGAGTLTYQWELSTTSAIAGFSAIGGATGITYDPGNLTQTTWYRRRVTDACGQVAYSNVIQVIVNTLSIAPTAITGTTTICAGGNTTLTVSGGSLGTGATFRWYSGACGGTFVGTGNSINVSPASNTTYYVRAEGTCNTTTCASRVITVNTLSTAPTAITGTSTICAGGNTTLTVSGGSLGTGAAFNWYSGACGSILVGSGNSINVNPASTTTYYVRAQGTCNTTACASQVVTVNTLSTAPTAITGTSTICAGDNTTLTVSGGSLGTGASFRWYSDACGGAFVGTGNSINVSPASNATYYVRAEGSCNTTGCAAVVVTVNTPSTAPTVTPIAGRQCPNTTLSLNAGGGTVGTGSNIYWYSGPNGTGSLLGTGTNLNITPSATTTYYARREGTCNNTSDGATTVQVRNYIYTGVGTTLANTYCTDNNGWHHFYTLGSEDIVFSMRGDLSGASLNPTISINNNGAYFQGTTNPTLPSSCVNGWTPGEEQFEMQRSWNVQFSGTLNPPYDVRYYFPASERTDVENAAINWMITYPACGYLYKYATPNGFYWFKNAAGNYTAPQFDGLHLTAASGTVNGVNYSEMTGIASFSGGTGTVTIVPNTSLPIELVYFSGKNEGATNKLEWETSSETNNAYFAVERSVNAQSGFAAIGQLEGAGDSNEPRYYTLNDLNPFVGVNYYRLKQVDYDGSFSYSSIIAIETKALETNHTFFPNPTADELTYQFQSTKEETLTIQIIDVLGRQVRSFEYQTGLGIQQLNINMRDLPPASYHVQVTDATGMVKANQQIVKVSR